MRKRVTSVQLVLVSDAEAVPIVATADDTLETVVELACTERKVRFRQFETGIAHCIRLVDRHGHEQPLDVELGLLRYPPGKVLYLRGCGS